MPSAYTLAPSMVTQCNLHAGEHRTDTCRPSELLSKPKSRIVLEAVAEYRQRIGKLRASDRIRMPRADTAADAHGSNSPGLVDGVARVVRIPALVLYEWLRGSPTDGELEAQDGIFPAAGALPLSSAEAAKEQRCEARCNTAATDCFPHYRR